MVAKEMRNVNMLRLTVFCLWLSCTYARIHTLKLENDSRKQITLSTFGFLSKGTLAVNISFSIAGSVFENKKDNSKKDNSTFFGFTLDKSKSPGLSSYMEQMQEGCILNKPDTLKENLQSVFFHFDLLNNRMRIERLGNDMKNLLISADPIDSFIKKHNLIKRDVITQARLSKLSDSYLVGSRRKIRQTNLNTSKTPSPTSTPTPAPVLTPTLPSTRGSISGSDANKVPADAARPKQEDFDKELVVQINMTKTKTENNEDKYQTYFLVYIRSSQEEGLYNLFFHNCMNGDKGETPVDLNISITENNNGNYLSAGEMPVPALYFTCSVIFFIAGVAWISVLHRSKETVFKIHYLMLVVTFNKSLACLFHGVNLYFIQNTGIHEDAWAILWYIVYLSRGALMFLTVLLIGAGWAFIKHVFTDKEKKLFMIIIPLQMLDQIAWVIIEESEEGNSSYTTWNEIFILVDLLCCGAILFPVVWSIRHLQEASHTDGKAAVNLQKLKLFRHFYIMVVCYIYFTRIIVYLLKITLPFKFEWLTDLFTELAMLIFFVVTGIKFRPASDNPYLQVPTDSDDEEIEMEEVLTKTGNTETVVKVNQKTEGSSNQVKQRESSHEFD